MSGADGVEEGGGEVVCVVVGEEGEGEEVVGEG